LLLKGHFMAIKNISLSDVADKLVVSSMNINDSSLTERKNNIFSTASYYLFSINKPAFAIELAENINPVTFSPSRDSPPLST